MEDRKQNHEQSSLQSKTYITAYIWRRLLRVEACMGHLDNMFQLSGLLLNLCSEEECGRSNNLVKEPQNKFMS